MSRVGDPYRVDAGAGADVYPSYLEEIASSEGDYSSSFESDFSDSDSEEETSGDSGLEEEEEPDEASHNVDEKPVALQRQGRKKTKEIVFCRTG